MTYLAIAVVGVAIIVVFAAACGRRKRAARPSEATVTVAQPAADEPTPGRSQTAPSAVVRNADRKTPPA